MRLYVLLVKELYFKMITLNNLQPSCSAYIASVTECDKIKRRLYELGFVVGNIVTPLYKSPLGDPTAYSIMGSVVALRNETTANITVKPISETEVFV